jgi:hypothetical protein
MVMHLLVQRGLDMSTKHLLVQRGLDMSTKQQRCMTRRRASSERVFLMSCGRSYGGWQLLGVLYLLPLAW